MKFKLLLLLTLCLTLSTTMYANTLVDSVGVENLNGKKVILHKLDPKDNYYSLGRKYGVSPKVIIQFNNNAKMAIGAIIKVPTERSIVETVGTPTTQPQQAQTKPAVQQPVTQPAQTQTKPVAQQPVTTTPAAQTKPVIQAPVTTNTTAQQPVNGATTQQYKVSQGETLYAIAKRFGTTVEDITALNKLTTSIQPGQILQVRIGTPAPQPQVAQATNTAPIDSLLVKRDTTYVSPDSLNRRNASNRYGLFEKNEKGVGTWIDDASLDPNKKLILHRTAPIGTVMRITNPMNNKTTFAKVVGRFTDNQSNKDALIVMTKNVAEALGALDKRFHVNISYGTPNE